MLSMGHFVREIVSRLHLQASYFSEDHAEQLMADLGDLLKMDWSQAKDLFVQRKHDLILSYGFQPTQQNLEKPFAFAEGVAFIPVHGMLVNRFSGSYGYVTGYNFIRSQRLAAEADPDVQAIVYDYNTYGGTAAGCIELGKELSQGGGKPSLGIIDNSCYSAGYLLGCTHDRLVGSPSSGTGSIGCISMHVDFTELLKNEGIKVSFFRSAPRKMESNPYEALSDKAKRSIQQSVDYHASAFIEHVVQSRGMEEADVRATEARCFDPPEALEAGLIDAVQSPADAISSFLGSLNGGSSTMQTTQNNGGSTTAATAPGMSAADIAKLVAETVSASLTTALPTALAAHDKAKTERRAAIMGCDEAKSRQKFAAHLADNTSMTVDEAKALLANAAEEKPQQTGRGTGRSPFHEAMDRTQNPHVGADSEGNGGGDPDNGGGGESDMAVASRILDTYASHTGNKVVPIKKTA